MAIIQNIRQLKNAGVLAERRAATASLELKRYNLIYGFNGAGKSTLSRVFASLQHGAQHGRLPANCNFEIEMDDGTKYACPKSLTGLEKRVCVFNHDFIAASLRWEAGAANPIFYIGADQADAAEQLKAKESEFPTLKVAAEGKANVLKERETAFTQFKRQLAREVSDRLRQPGRYEATQLMGDFARGTDPAHKLNDADLDAAATTSQRADPPAKVDPVNVPVDGILDACSAALGLTPQSIGSVVVAGLADHPEMVPWVRAGHQYHLARGLTTCLHCGEQVSDARRELLTSAFDDKLNAFIAAINDGVSNATEVLRQLDMAVAAIPAAAQLSAEFQPTFEASATVLSVALSEIRPHLVSAMEALKERQTKPTTPLTSALPPLKEIQERITQLIGHCAAVNAVIAQHAAMVDDFTKHQNAARLTIRQHFIALNKEAIDAHQASIDAATGEKQVADAAVGRLESEIKTLRMTVQEHGQAAEKINALVRSYLGHEELTIVPVEEGYELHRHGTLVQGPPSEGEKTAIALCYFLSTLEAEDRKIRDLIVVIDDPVSSLDTKAMNYACGLVRSRLNNAAQVIVLTHNQQCLNEFRKAWKGKTAGDKPTARLLYIDVAIPQATMTRTATIVDLPKQLREYDSEYHFLFQKVLQFEAADTGHFDYAFLMPNVLRRVLEIFLAFKVPRDGNLADKLKTLRERKDKLDLDRLNALERLSQVESHSDSLDDLIAISSMTIEESRDASAALIYLMKEVDEHHLGDLRKYCKP